MRLILLLLVALLCYGCRSENCDKNEEQQSPDAEFGITGNSVVKLQLDSTSLLRNPCTGWVIYDDAWLETENADAYWEAQNDNADRYASIFYIRYRWSDMEPEEGKYAWDHNPNFINHIKHAQKRGLKIAFRIYDNARDNLYQSTPEFVRKAGAEGFMINGLREQFWTPYNDDPIYQEKYSNFIRAFGQKFDDPDLVDFVDGVNLGFWGECHNIPLKDPTKLVDVYQWITDTYGNAFSKVILVANLASDFTYENEKNIAVQKNGYALRRDGLGSFWFRDLDRYVSLDAHKNKTLLLGEGAYWKGNDDNPDYRPWKSDQRMPENGATWRDFYELSLDDALTFGYNTLDLREVVETTGWTKYGNDLVKKFIQEGGYRLQPVAFSVPTEVKRNQKIAIGHKWRNVGTGIFPNNNRRWNYKYKVAFALIDQSDKVVCKLIDSNAEPSEWNSKQVYSYVYCTQLPNDIISGQYSLAFAIVDKTKDYEPQIELPVIGNTTKKWIPIAKIKIH